MNEIKTNLADALGIAKAKAYLGREIPSELQLEINKLMCDYNEALKKEKDGKG